MEMYVKGAEFKSGDLLIWTRENGSTEIVTFKACSAGTVAAQTNPKSNKQPGTAFPNQPTPLAIVTDSKSKEKSVPLSQLSRKK
jgi:hypothetical protein